MTQERALEVIPNQAERRSRRIVWLMVSKAAYKSRRVRQVEVDRLMILVIVGRRAHENTFSKEK